MEKTAPNSTPETEASIPGAQALLRGLDVLMCVGMSARPLRFQEIQEAVDLPKGTLHRLLSALQHRRVVRFDERTRRYHVGSRVFDLARRTIDQSSLIRATKPEIARLARLLNRPVCLYVPDGSDLFVLDFEDPDAAQSRMVRVWPRVSMSSSAAGLAMLAALRPDDRQATLGGDQPSNDLAMSQALGYTIAIDQQNSSRASVAAVVLDEAGYPMAAICCMPDVSAERAEQLHEIGRLVAEGGRRASGNFSVSSVMPTALRAPPSPPTRTVTNLETGRDYVGENPIWDRERHQLVWLDVLAPALRFLDMATGKSHRVPLPEITGGLAIDDEGGLILLGQKGIFRFNTDTGLQSLLIHPESDKPDNRFNSAAVSVDGALWAGTMAVNHTPNSGYLYRIGRDLSVRRTDAKIGLPKNAAWSPDGSHLYISDGATGCVMAYDCDLASARLTSPQVLVAGSESTGFPNGITVDSAGCIWVAMLGGWAINRYAADGQLLEQVILPVPMPVNLCFGGHDLKTLFITTTYLRLPPGFSAIAPSSGNVFKVEVDTPGLPHYRFGGVS